MAEAAQRVLSSDEKLHHTMLAEKEQTRELSSTTPSVATETPANETKMAASTETAAPEVAVKAKTLAMRSPAIKEKVEYDRTKDSTVWHFRRLGKSNSVQLINHNGMCLIDQAGKIVLADCSEKGPITAWVPENSVGKSISARSLHGRNNKRTVRFRLKGAKTVAEFVKEEEKKKKTTTKPATKETKKPKTKKKNIKKKSKSGKTLLAEQAKVSPKKKVHAKHYYLRASTAKGFHLRLHGSKSLDTIFTLEPVGTMMFRVHPRTSRKLAIGLKHKVKKTVKAWMTDEKRKGACKPNAY